jgi:hypothetical protein
MPFTGKATYTAGATLPEIAEDVADIIGIVSPYETPLLDHLGDPQRSATSTRHEWLEDALLPNSDTIDSGHSFTDPDVDTQFAVTHVDRFRVGDQIKAAGSGEVMFVTNVDDQNDTLTVVRGYGASTAEDLAAGQELRILGNAAWKATMRRMSDSPRAVAWPTGRRSSPPAWKSAAQNWRSTRSAWRTNWTTRRPNGCAN